MKNDRPDNVSDLHRGDSRAVVQGGTVATDKKVANPYYAIPLFGRAANASVSMPVLLCELCVACIWRIHFLHGYCFCQMDCYVNGDTAIKQLASSDVQPRKRRSNRQKIK